MPEPYVYQAVYPILWRDTDCFGHCRPSALLAYFQECALDAPLELGLTAEVLQQRYDAFWTLTRVAYTLTAPICWRDRLTLRTWHRQPKAMLVYRDFELLRDGVKVGEATALWGLAHRSTRRLINLDGVPELCGHTGGALCRRTPLRRLQLPEGLEPAGHMTVPYSQTDLNEHLNNGRYADLVCDCLPAGVLTPDTFVSGLQLDYLQECRAGDTLTLTCGGTGGRHTVSGRGTGDLTAFDAAMILSPCE